MAKIESIRPGGTLEASFATYPLAELLIGILRGNLSGRLDIFLHPEPKNRVFFRNGVPVFVDLPDAGASLVQILIEHGVIPRERGLDLLRLSEASGRSQALLIEQHDLLSAGALQDALQRLARAQVVRLFDIGPAEFRFAEGDAPPATIVPTILQPLPVVYEGLRRATNLDVVDRFLGTNGTNTFQLSATYPHGVDPFEWGEDVERAITAAEELVTLDGLVHAGLSRQVAGAAIMSAYLAGMMEICERDTKRAPRDDERRRDDVRRVPVDTSPTAAKDPSGLVIHRRSVSNAVPVRHAKDEPTLPPPPPPRPISSVEPSSPNPHDLEYTAVRDRLSPVRNQNYFQLLRVAPGTDLPQLERAYRFWMRKLDDEPDDVSVRTLRELLTDAYDVVRDPDRGRRYTAQVEQSDLSAAADRERLAFEAEPKVERAFRAMAANRTGAATYLLSWAEKQDGTRTDVPILFAMIDYLRTPIVQRVADALALQQVIDEELTKRAHDWRVRLCYGLLLAEQDDVRAARRNIAAAPDAEHPMVRRIMDILGDRHD